MVSVLMRPAEHRFDPADEAVSTRMPSRYIGVSER
jgi:hypothetical protein